MQYTLEFRSMSQEKKRREISMDIERLNCGKVKKVEEKIIR